MSAQLPPPSPPHSSNPKKRLRDWTDEEDQEDAPRRASKRARLSMYYSPDTNAPPARVWEMCDAPQLLGKRRRDQMEDAMREDMRTIRPAPEVQLPGSQILYGIICADSVGEFNPDRTGKVRFAELPFDDATYLEECRASRMEAEETAPVDDPTLAARQNAEKWKKWFEWKAMRHTAKVRRQRDQFMDRLLTAAGTPLEVEIVEQALETYERKWDDEVYPAMQRDAVDYIYKTMDYMLSSWNEPSSESPSQGNTGATTTTPEDEPSTRATKASPAPSFCIHMAPRSPSPPPGLRSPTVERTPSPEPQAGPSRHPNALILTVPPPLPSPSPSPPPSLSPPPPAVEHADLREDTHQAEVVPPRRPMSLRSGFQVASRVVYVPKKSRGPRGKGNPTS